MQAQTSQSDLRRMKRECWRPGCKRRAFIRDWKGWRWCLHDWWRQAKDEPHWWIEIRGMRFF